MCIPGFAHFGTVSCLSDREAVQFNRAFGRDELKDLKCKLLQTLLKIQAFVIDLGERFV